MSTGAIIALVIILALLVAAATAAGMLIMRRLALRRRVARLDLRPLTAEQRGKYCREWTSAQEMFVDSPAQAAEAAGALVTAVAADRGYPADDHEQLLSDLSVHHARLLTGYRRARQTTQSGAAKTEELRQAMLAYRALFRDLLGPLVSGADQPAADDGADVTSAGAPGARVAAGLGTGGTAAAGTREARAMPQATRKE
jgi:hypothetical protein